MKSLKLKALIYFLAVFFHQGALSCVEKEELQEASDSRYTGADFEATFCPVVERWFKDGMCKEDRREKIKISKVNAYLNDYYEYCLEKK